MIITFLFFSGFLFSLLLAYFAHQDKNSSELRLSIAISVLYLLLFLDRTMI